MRRIRLLIGSLLLAVCSCTAPQTESVEPAAVSSTPPAATSTSSSTWTAPARAQSAPSSSGRVHVKGYYRKDGTYVRPHTRRYPKRR